jgi:hypothetical protein
VRRRRSGALRCLTLVGAVLVPLTGCEREVTGSASAAPAPPAPRSAEELEPLLVTAVPSGLPRLPDGEVHPPAGEKTLEDVAAYARDPQREQTVLEEYGYRFGWERFWGTDEGALTSVFVHQMETRGGADAYARDLAANDAEYYRGVLRENPHGLPGGCWLLTVGEARPESRLPGPAAITWCGHGVFSVSVTAVADSVSEAEDEVRALLPQQLERLPPR